MNKCFLLVALLMSPLFSASADVAPLITNAAFDNARNATLTLQAWPGDYVIQTATNLHGAWISETNVSVGSSGSVDISLPVSHRDQLFLRAMGKTPSDGRGCVAQFLTQGSSFSPEVEVNAASLQGLSWFWSDGTTDQNLLTPYKNFGTTGSRWQGLLVSPATALTAINLGFDGRYGSTTPLPSIPAQKVGAVRFPYPLPNLRYWASSYNPIASLDFSGFTSLQAIECFRCDSLQHIVATDLPLVKRINVQDCDLRELDLSGDPNLEELWANGNAFTSIQLARGTGPNVRTWSTSGNPQLTQRLADIMTNFFAVDMFQIWSNNQSGALSLISTNLAYVEAYGNHFTAADFTGKSKLWMLRIGGNELTNLVLTGCSRLQYVDARENRLNAASMDALLAGLESSVPGLRQIDLSRNAEMPTSAVYAHYTNLLNRGVSVILDWPEYNDTRIDVPGGQNAITFVTTNQTLQMEIRSTTATNIIWHWGDGTVTRGPQVANHNFAAAGLHTNYVEVLPTSGITYFGARQGVTRQGIRQVYGLANYPNLNFLYLFRESITDLSLAGCAQLRQLHLAENPVSVATCDGWFMDLDRAVAGPVSGAEFYFPAACRSSASDAAYNSLIHKGFIMYPF